MIKILIVDDERVERAALKQILEEGIENIRIVGEAENGTIAIQMVEKLEPDLILMDIQMPETDGLEAILEISKLNSGIQYIIISAYDTFEYARQALRLGVNDYLLKPSRPKSVIETVTRVIQRIHERKKELELMKQEKERLKQLLSVFEGEQKAQRLIDEKEENKLKQFIMENYHKDITLETVAEHVNLSPYYVSKLFKEKSGTNFIDFLTECRIENAKRLMGDPSKSLKEIAIDVGFHDPSYFSRVFKRSQGISPTDYRKIALQHHQKIL
ncbi:response regulator [Bacillus sp. FJAT-29814]|uniref:response regulator transcription factor n=1 Tax=Bacillus sp. FJAT-29814 TaxID=1729688 RepID=UPI00082DC462|nr:response regulator [Bacillus sp. FJAT-29814]